MKDVFGLRKRRNAQTLVFFLLAWGTIMLLCGLAIDSGLLYLAKARLSRAVDGAALAAVGNFNRNSGNASQNRDTVALIMRNFAVANYTDLTPIGVIGSVGAPAGGTSRSYLLPNGSTAVDYTYIFTDGALPDPNGAYKRFVQVTLNTGSGGAITGATCNARCPVQTYFIGYATYAINGRQNVKIAGYSGVTGLMDLKVSSSAQATRNPRLIMVVLDRSASMLESGGGATGLAPAVVQFLDFFDTSSDTIGIVSFGSNARLEMPMTTNFIIAGTNNLIDGYATNLTVPGLNTPGVDPESVTGNTNFQQYYATTGIRRLKFGGTTAADDGIRLALEQMMSNPGFNDPDVVKYMVIFTDGKWNSSRTLFAAPGYTNRIYCPNPGPNTMFVANGNSSALANGAPGPWKIDTSADTNLIPVPSMGLLGGTNGASSVPFVINAINKRDTTNGNPAIYYYYESLVGDHTNDVWQSVDASGYEPLNNPSTTAINGAEIAVTNTTLVGYSSPSMGTVTNYYTHDTDVWLQPGSIAYLYSSLSASTPSKAWISDYTKPTKHIYVNIPSGWRLDLVVPGYVADGLWYDGLDMSYPSNPNNYASKNTYPVFRCNNYQEGFMWPDDTNVPPIVSPYDSGSLLRQLMYRNYANLMTGFYISRADDPPAPYIPSRPVGQQGIEPLVSDSTNSAGAAGATRPANGLGCYYPGAGFYWPFGGTTDANGYVIDAVGLDYDETYALPNPNSDPDPNYSSQINGGSRHGAYSLNMLSTNAAPEWYGELFYHGSGGVPSNNSGSQSDVMHSTDWQAHIPPFVSRFSGVMYAEPNHNANIGGQPSVWRPRTFNGSNFPTGIDANGIPNLSSPTSGYVSDGQGHYFYNSMAYSGRPTHYYDFSLSSWEPIQNNHVLNMQALPLGNWKAGEYAWHARALGVTIYTVGYGKVVTEPQCAFLATIANATNEVFPIAAGSSTLNTNSLIGSYNPGQPIGQQFYATTAAQISNDFYSIGQAINAALTQ